MKKIIEFLKEAGLTKLVYGAIALGTALISVFGIMNLWWAFHASLAIFLYINGNILWKKVFHKKTVVEKPIVKKRIYNKKKK